MNVIVVHTRRPRHKITTLHSTLTKRPYDGGDIAKNYSRLT